MAKGSHAFNIVASDIPLDELMATVPYFSFSSFQALRIVAATTWFEQWSCTVEQYLSTGGFTSLLNYNATAQHAKVFIEFNTLPDKVRNTWAAMWKMSLVSVTHSNYAYNLNCQEGEKQQTPQHDERNIHTNNTNMAILNFKRQELS